MQWLISTNIFNEQRKSKFFVWLNVLEQENAKELFSKDYAEIPLEETWRGMEECYRLGYAKSIGLSNFNSLQIERILAVAKVKPVVNQVECHPNLNQKKLREFCAARGIIITSYSPLGAPLRPWAKPGDPMVVIGQPEIVEMGKKYRKTPAQIVLRYLVYEYRVAFQFLMQSCYINCTTSYNYLRWTSVFLINYTKIE